MPSSVVVACPGSTRNAVESKATCTLIPDVLARVAAG